MHEFMIGREYEAAVRDYISSVHSRARIEAKAADSPSAPTEPGQKFPAGAKGAAGGIDIEGVNALDNAGSFSDDSDGESFDPNAPDSDSDSSPDEDDSDAYNSAGIESSDDSHASDENSGTEGGGISN